MAKCRSGLHCAGSLRREIRVGGEALPHGLFQQAQYHAGALSARGGNAYRISLCKLGEAKLSETLRQYKTTSFNSYLRLSFYSF